MTSGLVSLWWLPAAASAASSGGWKPPLLENATVMDQTVLNAINVEVTGAIDLDASIRSFNDAVLRIYIEDVTRQDVGGKQIAEKAITGVSHPQGCDDHLEFSIPCEFTDDRASYSVRAHLDVDASGAIKRSDYVTTQSFPVLTHGYGSQVLLRMKSVS